MIGAPVVLLLLASPLTAGCDGTAARDMSYRPTSRASTIIRVPERAPTIQAAVDSARPGDLVLVSPGVYREAVTVRTARVVLRGTDRNGVVLDGEFRRGSGIVVTAPGVAIENLTVRAYKLNGVLVTGMPKGAGSAPGNGSADYRHLDTKRFPPLRGYRVSYVTAANNGLYGVYAFDARDGQIDHTYTSGHADSGLYVGQCKPCNALVADNVAERNAVGYEGTNASGNLFVVRNRFIRNRVGMTSNSNALEALAPQDGAVLAGNVVTGNNAADTPEQADGGFGIGVGIGGGTRNLVVRNLIRDNRRAGVLLTNADTYAPRANTVDGNRVTGNGTDLAYVPAAGSEGTANCFRDNAHGTSTPRRIEREMACGRDAPVAPGRLGHVVAAPPGISFHDVTAPPPQPQMPGGPGAPARPATGLPPSVDLASVPLPRSRT